MNENAEKAVAMFNEGFNCAQAVLTCCGKAYGLDRQVACRVAQAFGGGMGRMGLTCGAVTGAFMVIGLKYAKTTAGDDGGKEKALELTRRFAENFTARHGSLACRELLGCDISTPAGFEATRQRGLFADRCPRLVRAAVEIVENLLTCSERSAS